jgi:hypothetical protein
MILAIGSSLSFVQSTQRSPSSGSAASVSHK